MFNMFIAMVGVGLIIPIMPKFLSGFGVAGQALGFIIATFSLSQFLFSPIAGRLSDQKGRKRIILIGLFIYGVSQLTFSLSTELWMLYVSRFLTGFGSAFMIPPMMAFVADLTSVEERGKGMGLLGASMSLGFMIGPAIGGFLASISLHFPMYVAAGASFVALFLSILFLPYIEPTAAQIEQAKQKSSLWQQLKQSTKEPYFMMLIVMFVFSFGLANFQATLSMFMNYKFGFGPQDIAILLTVGGFIGVIIQSLFIHPLFKRFGEMRIVLFNLLMASISMVGILFVHVFWTLLFVSTIFSIATTLLRPAVNTLISKMAGEAKQGFAAGMMNAYMSLGNMVGPALAGTLFDWNMSYPYMFGALILLLAFALTYSWGKKNETLVRSTRTY